MTSQFTTSHGSVYMGQARLSEESVEALLDIFQREGAAGAFNDLWDARASLSIPKLAPLSCSVRQLDPSAWADALREAS